MTLSHAEKPPVADLVERFYPELRRIAGIRMAGERLDHTWQPTILVNELYLELARMKELPVELADEREKGQFLRLSAFLMKRLLIQYSRPLRRKAVKLDLAQILQGTESATASLREVEELLNGLGRIDPLLRTVVEMKVFEGLRRQEIAERLGCSVRTVARHWEFAQQWLRETIDCDFRA